MLKIVVDAMGGDKAPGEIVKGVTEALRKREGFSVILMGDETAVTEELKKYKYDPARVEIVHTTQVITNDDQPTKAIRSMTDSSLTVAFDRLKKDPEVGALVSAGSTGAVLAGGIFMVGRVKGISRPALCPAMPNVRGTQTLLCDCGANVECKPINFVHFALMASAYAQAAFGVENPRVGLLNNGTEAHKGDEIHREAYELLSKTPGINFCGNAEGRDIMCGDFDVVVCDGFSGNIALKSIEGCGHTVRTVLKQSIYKNIFTKICGVISLGILGGLQDAMDYHKYGGAVLLGLKKPVIKSHGSSKAKTIRASVLKAVDACENRLTEKLEAMLSVATAEEAEN